MGLLLENLWYDYLAGLDSTHIVKNQTARQPKSADIVHGARGAGQPNSQTLTAPSACPHACGKCEAISAFPSVGRKAHRKHARAELQSDEPARYCEFVRHYWVIARFQRGASLTVFLSALGVLP